MKKKFIKYTVYAVIAATVVIGARYYFGDEAHAHCNPFIQNCGPF